MDQSFLQDKRASAAQCLQNLATNSPKGDYNVTCKQYNATDEVHDKHKKSMTILFHMNGQQHFVEPAAVLRGINTRKV
jgi:hypothetical protein